MLVGTTSAAEVILKQRLGLDHPVQRQQLFEQGFHVLERHGIRSVAHRVRWVGMGFHEQTGHADGHRSACEHRHELTLAAAARALAAGQLHRMRGVEDHWRTGLAHDRQAAHV